MQLSRESSETRKGATCWLGFMCFGFSLVSAAAESPISLPGDRAFPESITALRDGTLFVGSVVTGGVYRIDPRTHTATTWIQAGTYGTRSITGVLADERAQTLWVCSNDLSGIGVAGPSAVPGSALKGFDLKSGVGKISAALPGDKTLCNDIAIGPDGSAYVTNSAAPEILRLSPKGKQLEVWASDPSVQPPAGGSGLDGIAFSADGNLYVDTYTPGDLYRVEVRSAKAGKFTKLKVPRPLVLTDAIRVISGNTFLLIEGGGRLDRMTVNGEAVSIDILKGGFSVPTGVAIVGHTAWVSEGQLSYLFDPAKKGQSPNLPFRIYPVEIPAH